ncbi:ABC transporter permease [Picosynechococcus sp. PCC 7117]|uniref:ABC transporter permease n=1 Tax=Picosynechococcus sp. PCC 7117 TaxID=195498 RepID=UPI00081087DA|nr:ABC transporter permease [Picosynechococcus sp. PCC 7117]ANV87335.1 ABC transporter permease [Picosynechococcus sp. PCC 7117]
MVAPLDRKLWRDLQAQWGQLLAIALVVACGIACFVMMLSAYHSLVLTQMAYYERYRFGEVFAELKRAPQNLQSQIAAINAVQEVQTRIVADITLNVPGLLEPATARLISLPPKREGMLNGLFLRSPGTFPDPQQPEEVLISEAFAKANQIQVGDRLGAILNGRWQNLRVTGIALSPEYIYAVSGGNIYPDDKRFGILWANETALSHAFGLDGAFNSVVLTLTPGANERAVITQLDHLLEGYGGLGAYGRRDQFSHRIVSDEIQSLEVSATILPTIFLAIAAFLLHILISRLIAIQRGQIAVLKAFGYTNVQVGWHYLKFMLLVFSGGAVLGLSCGLWLGQGLTQLYADFFHFPFLRYEASALLIITALLISGGAACIGGLMAVREAILLPPAEGMRPKQPVTFRATIVERLGLQRFFSPAGRIILRNLERRPLRASLSILGIAVAVAILLTGFGLQGSMTALMDIQFQIVQREDMTLTFNQLLPYRSRYHLRHLPGILKTEVFRSVPVRLRHGHYQYRLAITGLEPQGELRQLVNRQLQPVSLPPGGLVLGTKLGEILHIQPGDRLGVEVLEGKRQQTQTWVMGLVDEPIGLSAYMNLAALNQMLGEGQVISGAYVLIDSHVKEQLYQALKQLPAIEGIAFREALLESFQAISGESLQIMTGIIVLFACIITFSVVYNSARLALSERNHELATLRVMGFTQTEIAFILLGEQTLLTFIAVPLGLGLGVLLLWLLVQAYNTELYRLPLTLNSGIYGLTALIVIVTSLISNLLIYSQLQALNLVTVLKIQE